MNITLMVDQRHTYREALKIAYDKAKQEGTLDELTEKSCQIVFNSPPPSTTYHESDNLCTEEEPAHGGFYTRSWTHRESYEQARINARVCFAESLHKKITDTIGQINTELPDSGMENMDTSWSLKINEKGILTAVATRGELTPSLLDSIERLLGESETLRHVAREYAAEVESLIGRTLDGADAPYASYFKASDEA